MSPGSFTSVVIVLAATVAGAGDDGVLYRNDFQSAAVDSVPDDFLVLAGAFAVKEEDGNRFLELPGAPLESFGVLFGPTESVGVEVAARIHGSAKGRRYPVMGVGLNGVSGYRLLVAPGKRALEIAVGDETQTSVPFEWKPDTWTQFRLRVREAGEKIWVVEGKAWAEGEKEPDAWMIAIGVKEAPPSGRATLWGSPFSGKPIRYDELVVKKSEVNQ